MTAMTSDAETRVRDASTHLYAALTKHFSPLDLGADQPIVKSLSEYQAAARRHDDTSMNDASKHIYQALTARRGNLDLDAHDEFVRALSEYGTACKAAGPRS
jgi:hypothetical protein